MAREPNAGESGEEWSPSSHSSKDQFFDGFLDDGLADGDFIDGGFVDDAIRFRFAQTFPLGHDSVQALEELRPAALKARRRWVLGQAAAWSSAAAVVVIGLFAVGGLVPDGSETVAAVPGPADSTSSGIDGEVGPEVSSTVGSLLPAPADSSGVAGPAHTSGTSSSPQSAVTEQEAVVSSSATSGAPATSSTETTAAPNSSRPPGSSPGGNQTTSSVAVTTPPGTVLDSACGTIRYRVDGERITLVDVEAGAGVRSDVGNRGPERVEVSFEGGAGHCELKVELEDGRINEVVSDEAEDD